MYTRDLSIASLDVEDDVLEALKSVAVPEGLTSSIARDIDDPKGETAYWDLIIADLSGSGPRSAPGASPLATSHAIKERFPDAALIAFVSPEDVPRLEGSLELFYEIWVSPVTPGYAAWRLGSYYDRIKGETDAWQTEQFLEATIDSIPSLVWYKTSDGVHEKVNDAFCEATGKTKEQAQGARHAYIWDVEDDDPACIESERQVMDTRSTVVSEEVIQVGDDKRILTTYKSPLYDFDGTPMGTAGVGIDITKERAYEQKILERNKTLETIITSLQCGVLTHTIDGSRIASVNQAALDLLGYGSAEEMMEDGFDMVAATVVPEDAARMRSEMSKLRYVGETVATEYTVRHADGEELHLMGSVKLIEDNGERLFQRFMVDITERKIEESLREERQRELVQALSEDYLVVCAFDLGTGKGEALRIESGATGTGSRLSSYFSGVLDIGTSIGAYIDDAVMKDDRAMLRGALSASNLLEELADSKRIYVNYRTQRAGKVAYCQATVVKTGEWDGEAREVVIGFRNVDQQTREEMRKKALMEEALDAANKASEAKTAFLNNMSHDIRTPMNAIVGFTSLAASRIDHPDKVMEYLDKIQQSSTHLLSLINDILDMSRIESGKVALDETPCSLPELLEGLHSIMASDMDAARLRFEVESELRHPDVACDKLRMNQIMLNLLGNAVKFTPAGGTVTLAAREIGAAQKGYGRYRFTVTDTGIGMSEEFQERIFDPFEREHTSTVSGLEGTGLGMAITKNLVDMMGGTIKVASVEGLGTTFTIDVALRIDDRSDEEREEGAALPQDDGAPVEPLHPMRGSHILLVDDNMLNREIASTLLEDEGFSVEVATNGQEAVDALIEAGAGHFDLVLMDIQMPVLNGYEATKRIRKLDDAELAAVPVIAVTADAFEEDKQKAVRAGMDGHISKPIETEKLFEALNSILAGRR